jgi:hypothetical protein
MHRTLAAALLIGVVASGAPALAQQHGAQQNGPLHMAPPTDAPNPDADAFLRDTIGRFVDALGQVIEALPRYAPPAVDKDGNIILRRLNPPDHAPQPELPPPGWTLDRTST